MSNRSLFRKYGAPAVVLVALAALAACSLDKVAIPGFIGPSEFGLALKLTVTPDLLIADGTSQAVIRVEARGPDGKAVAGQDVFFEITDASGAFANIGTLNANRAATAADGFAQVLYTSPQRTDFTANSFVMVVARTVGSDAGNQTYRSVRLELRSAEPRLFPPNPLNCPSGADEGEEGCPFADFRAEFGPDGQLLLQTICVDSADSSGRIGTIVRYSWDFGDGSEREDKPDVNHRYSAPGIYNVQHACTDDNGALDVITKPFQIE
jgi:hypothetical protein